MKTRIGKMESSSVKGKFDHAGPIIRALVVDDESSMIRVVSHMLDALGIHTDEANGGEEALHYLQNGNYDLVITDLQMPDMSGHQLASWIKCKSKRTKVIIMTADSSAGAYHNIQHSPADNWIFKPFSFLEFKNIINHLTLSV